MKVILLFFLYCTMIISNPFICTSTILVLKNYKYVIFFNIEDKLKTMLMVKCQNFLINNTNTNTINNLRNNTKSKNNTDKINIFLEDAK